MRRFLAICALLTMLGISEAGAQPLLHPLFTDHMVLQRDRPIAIWGWSAPGATVTVKLLGQQAHARADADGRWRLALGPLHAHGPCQMQVSDGTQHVTLDDVLVGDVWLCSGQSNMTFPVRSAVNGADEAARGGRPLLRLYTVPPVVAPQPRDVFGTLSAAEQKRLEFGPVNGARWLVASPQNIAAFSAVGYFFGRDLQADLNVPIGLIHASWPGTCAEAWTSAPVLRTLPDLPQVQGQLDALQLPRAERARQMAQRLDSWYQRNDMGSISWAAAALDVEEWRTMNLPTVWEHAGLKDFDGVVWFRREVDVPAEMAGRDLTLDLGPIDDCDTTWFNGTLVGATNGWNIPRHYRVPGTLVKAGRNVIAVRVLDTGGDGGIYGAGQKMRLWLDAAHAIPLEGDWLFRVGGQLAAADLPPLASLDDPNLASVLFNGMIAPLIPFTMRGVIWYQGESNSGRAGGYRALLTAMIGDWRARLGPLPFLIVGLANYDAIKRDDWPALREAQWQVSRSVADTALAEAIDVGEAHDIHPRNKQAVGQRLALAARALVYGEKVVSSGPAFRAISRAAANRLRLSFDHAEGLRLRAADEGFEIAGADGRFALAHAVVVGDVVEVWADEVTAPVAVRYAWASNPPSTLYNAAGLPAIPFRASLSQ